MNQNGEALQKIRKIGNYQFGKGVGSQLFPENVEIVCSKNTGRIRHVFLNDELLATLRPTDGFFALTIAGARRIMENVKPSRLWVKVITEAEEFVKAGRSVFAKHVVDADEEIRAGEEVIVIGEGDKVLAVGAAILTGREMKAFKRGAAVRVRRGIREES
ncbi:MAG: PUA domain-containing protein [Thermoproteota archaeon]|nr:PUA domain-containing protein [Thermoproteota archaeon]